MISKCPNCGANLNNLLKCNYCNSIHYSKISLNDVNAILELADMLPYKYLAKSDDESCANFLIKSVSHIARKDKLRILAILSAKGYNFD